MVYWLLTDHDNKTLFSTLPAIRMAQDAASSLRYLEVLVLVPMISYSPAAVFAVEWQTQHTHETKFALTVVCLPLAPRIPAPPINQRLSL